MDDRSIWHRVLYVISCILGFIPTVVAYIKAKRLKKDNIDAASFRAFTKARHASKKSKH